VTRGLTTPGRLVALGASNLVRGLRVLVAAAREAWGDPIEVFAALGHGRSYGLTSTFAFVRSLPGIDACGLWAPLGTRPPLPTRALVTDVGNDVLYGAAPDRILTWVEQAVARLQDQGAEVVLTDLPMESIETIGRLRFAAFRSLFVPSCRLDVDEVRLRSRTVQQGLIDLASRREIVLVRLQPEWYGIDPIHIRPRYWAAAWRTILSGGDSSAVDVAPQRPATGTARWERFAAWLRYYRLRPERRWLFGSEQRSAQPALTLAGDTTLWLY
jgi:hypothetical protein